MMAGRSSQGLHERLVELGVAGQALERPVRGHVRLHVARRVKRDDAVLVGEPVQDVAVHEGVLAGRVEADDGRSLAASS